MGSHGLALLYLLPHAGQTADSPTSYLCPYPLLRQSINQQYDGPYQIEEKRAGRAGSPVRDLKGPDKIPIAEAGKIGRDNDRKRQMNPVTRAHVRVVNTSRMSNNSIGPLSYPSRPVW